jgi:hypothetical protein
MGGDRLAENVGKKNCYCIPEITPVSAKAISGPAEQKEPGENRRHGRRDGFGFRRVF